MSSTETTRTSSPHLGLRILVIAAGLLLALAALGPRLGETRAARLLPCPIRAVSGEVCPGCGMTRACIALLRGQWHLAWDLHPFAFGLAPLALLWALAPQRVASVWGRVPHRGRNLAYGLVIAGLLFLWLARISGS